MTKSTKTPVVDQAKEHVQDIADTARDKIETKARSEAENLKDAAAEEATNAANAADAAASEFDSDSIQAKAIEQVASRIEDIAAQIRSSDVDRLARTVRQTAERNPLMFVAGAALAGFAVTRFLKARDPHVSHSYRRDDDPWASDPSGQPRYGSESGFASTRGSV